MFRSVLVVALLSSPFFAQSTAAGHAGSPQASSSTPVLPGDDFAQLGMDLDRLESLLNNMSSETEFLHDQNLQILLRTNSQMWTILIRDMRQQLAREQRRWAAEGSKGTAPATQGSPPRK